ncbi:MAG: aminomethyl-transferring glycine dehydrogenase subunit GcvPA [Syntrophomonadaceae bacterium]|nr:aminomethyl-transferring glycine dehydrogenase subunit GcvPA [Syntrophomonadaceae bacterium]MDD3889210.1 aminomethyl-transferring glycine dehydrogenase subunit GcvPA [Syntrophomonadaceae bacterium]MDD4549742.1 aminomethyl-transferring glycine dehydrogenase subunit GcvPA [Syntrophomonadaceae bacterium]
MSKNPNFVHPYIPNSASAVEQDMLQEVSESAAENLYKVIPQQLKLNRRLDLPEPFFSEYELKKHVQSILDQNKSCEEYVSFLGAGCWQHYVPAVCDEVNNRAEFLTAYWGDTYSDFGKWQAMFEYQSMMGELLDMEVVSTPTYDWSSAVSSALMMSARITGRSEALVVSTTGAERLMHMRNFCHDNMEIKLLQCHPNTGLIDLEDLQTKVSSNTAAVYFENPGFLGFMESQGSQIAEIAHAVGSLIVVGVDPSSLGIMAPPITYGADIVCGDAQPFGNHMNYGGGVCGFIATRDEERFVAEYPTILISIAAGKTEKEWGFGQCTHDRTSYVRRDLSPDFIGTSQWLCAITAAVYLSLMGPAGMVELGEGIMQRCAYAMKKISGIEGAVIPLMATPHFKEFVVDFNASGKMVAEINKKLLNKGIFGGKDLSKDFPELGQSALYCVTEIHTKDDIDNLVKALEEVLA